MSAIILLVVEYYAVIPMLFVYPRWVQQIKNSIFALQGIAAYAIVHDDGHVVFLWQWVGIFVFVGVLVDALFRIEVGWCRVWQYVSLRYWYAEVIRIEV